ncbi:uncharacterized protein BDW47DRAFT_40000 [Aspergillus candidus]|uniref:DUF7896 domain-containing protein n=1 Tax=Aspergillus candidus TaxID=41067 RepID=A0A2I2F901_ASPCN|nr:hypothetical protein BDW47DRAFT_40000 [Aspergillus candidus]PLB37112.1 hypothetical protein BDW47DRAFT_40000 [Aspergillus candidus]
MSATMANDDMFSTTISMYRDYFMDQHSHLSESERNQLWSQRLSSFIPTTASSSSYRPVPGSDFLDLDASPCEKSGKRTRQETPRTLPVSGPPPTKRRVTTPEPPVTVDLTRDLSHSSSPAAPQTTRKVSRSASRKEGVASSMGLGSTSRHNTSMVRSQSQQTPVSHQHAAIAAMMGQRQFVGSQRPQRRLDYVNEYSPSEYTRRYLDGPQGQAGISALSMTLAADPTMTGLQQSHPQPNSQHLGTESELLTDLSRLGSSSMGDLAVPPASSAIAMSRSPTTDSLCGGLGMMRCESSDPSVGSGFPFPCATGFSSTTPPVNVPFINPFTAQPCGSQAAFPYHEPSPLSQFSCSAPPTTSFPPSMPTILSSPAPEMKHSMSTESDSSCLSQPSRAARRTQEQIAQGTRPIAPKMEAQHSSPPKTGEQHKMIRISSTDGIPKEVAAIPKASVQRPPRPKTYCDLCNDQPDGFHGEHELRRHIERVHAVVRKVWVCNDISAGKTFLANCKACRNGKRYGANYNAAAHLRRTHFNPCQRGRGGRGKDSEKRGGKGGGNHPPMDVLKHWMIQREEIVLENAQSYVDQDLGGDDLAVAPSTEVDESFCSVSTSQTTDPGLALPQLDQSALMSDYEAFSTGFPMIPMDSASLDVPCYFDSHALPPAIDSYV